MYVLYCYLYYNKKPLFVLPVNVLPEYTCLLLIFNYFVLILSTSVSKVN